MKEDLYVQVLNIYETFTLLIHTNRPRMSQSSRCEHGGESVLKNIAYRQIGIKLAQLYQRYFNLINRVL